MAVAIGGALGFLLTLKLGTLVAGFSAEEIMQRSEASSFIGGHNPLFFIQNIAQYGLQQLNHFGPVAMRLPGVILGALVVLTIFKILDYWYTARVAILGALVLATSSWFLHTIRLSTHDAVYLLLFVLFALTMWLQRAPANRLAMLSCLAVALICLYTPGLVWFIVPLLVWQRRRLKNILATFSRWQLIVTVLFSLAAIMPLLWASIHTQDFVVAWLGLPRVWPPVNEIAKNVARLPFNIFWHGPNDPTHWLGRLPLLDWFQAVMFIVGIYSYRFKVRLDRTLSLIYILCIGSLLVALKGPVSLALLLPFVFLIVMSGVAFMLQQWFTVFPRNPFARMTGFVLLILALLISCTYQLGHYFVAWPKTPETKAVFVYRP